jgi:hypothetical protein
MKYDRLDDIEWVKLSKKMKIQSGFTCELCGRRGVELHVHHKNSYDWDIPGRYDTQNLIVLCSNDHHSFHSIFGYGKNTELQFAEYKQMHEVLMKIAENKNTTENIVRNIINICKDDGYAPDGYTA